MEWALAEHLRRGAADLAEATRSAYATQAGHLVRLLGAVPLNQLTRGDLEEYAEQRENEDAGPETRRKELVLLRAAVRRVRELGAQTREPESVLFPRLKSAYVPCERWLTFKEYQSVRSFLSEDRELQLTVACFSGARRAELQRMRWEDCDWDRNELTVHQSKPAKSRRKVPMPKELQRALRPLRQDRGPLLAPLANFYRDIKRACIQAGVPRFSFNDCRRTFASWMLQEGVPLYDVSKLLGHRSIAMVQKVYGHLSDDSMRRAVQKLPTTHSPQQPRAGRNGRR